MDYNIILFENEIFIDYDVLLERSDEALRARVDGWCRPEFIDHHPPTFDLYAFLPGIKIGSLEIRRLPGSCSLIFRVHYGINTENNERQRRRERLMDVWHNYITFFVNKGLMLPDPKPETDWREEMKEANYKPRDDWDLHLIRLYNQSVPELTVKQITKQINELRKVINLPDFSKGTVDQRLWEIREQTGTKLLGPYRNAGVARLTRKEKHIGKQYIGISLQSKRRKL